MAFHESPDLKDVDNSKCQPKPIRIRSESGTEDVHYPIQYEGLPEEAKLYAQRKLNETEDNKVKGIRKLKEYMKRENLTCPDDRMLIAVLRNCKYNFKKSETKLKQFLKLRKLIGEKLKEMDTHTISVLLEEFVYVALPFRDKHGRVIIYTQPSPNIDKYDPAEIVSCGLATILYLLSFPMASIYGATHLAECHTPHLPIFYSIFKVLKIVVTRLRDVPGRLARVDIFNEHFLCRWCHNMLRPFIPEKIKKRVMFHGSGFDSVHKLFHPDILPYEVGGTMGPLSIKHYKEELMCFIERLRDENC